MPRQLQDVLATAWNAATPLAPISLDSITHLAREKYVFEEWNFEF